MIRWMIAALLALLSAAALAHKPSDSYLTLRVEGREVQGQWDIALRDLDFAIGLDGDGDDAITWGEVRGRSDDIFAYALARLALGSGQSSCPLERGALLADYHSDGAYAVLRFRARCPGAIERLEARYALLFDVDPQHKGLLNLLSSGAARTAVFSPERPAQTFVLAERDLLGQFLDYLVEGVWHIWIGIDHILFLLSLLLPSVLLRRGARWGPSEGFRSSFWDVFKIVTSFTVAHSITLALAALGLVELPSRLVESAIAASVLLAAANNVYPVVDRGRWMVAFLFGLIHGFGFASVLADLGLPQDTLLIALVGFNVGVEAGQLAIVAVFLPVAYALRATALYRLVVMTGGSLLIALIALMWLIERALVLEFMPF